MVRRSHPAPCGESAQGGIQALGERQHLTGQAANASTGSAIVLLEGELRHPRAHCGLAVLTGGPGATVTCCARGRSAGRSHSPENGLPDVRGHQAQVRSPAVAWLATGAPSVRGPHHAFPRPIAGADPSLIHLVSGSTSST